MSEKTTYVIELNDKMSPKLKAATAQALGLDKAVGSVGKKGSKAFSELSDVVKGFIGPLGAAAAGMAAFKFVADSVRVTREFEALETSLNFISGSASEGAKTMSFLRKRSKEMGTDLMASAEGFKTLSGAMMGTALEGQATKDIFDSIQIASTVMGLDAEQSKGALLALGQMMGKGKVQAEELRGQLGERIPGAFNIAARAMGMTTSELDKFMSEGKLLSVDFLPKFAKELKNTFGEGMDEAAKSSTAQLNRFNNALLDLKLMAGEELMPVLNNLSGWFVEFVEHMKEVKELEGGKPFFETFKKNFFGNNNLYGWENPFFGRPEGFDIKDLARKGRNKDLDNFLKTEEGKGEGNALFKALTGIRSEEKRSEILKRTKDFNLPQSPSILGEDIQKSNLQGLKNSIEETKKAWFGFLGSEKETSKSLFSDTVDFFKTGILPEWARMKDKKTGASTLSEGGGDKSTTSIDGIKSGRPTNVNINIGKLIEEQNITAGNVEDMVNQIQDLVTKALLSSVNNANLIAR
ncbi:putative tape measure protein [uncultured Mediterranean phage uvMED]|nr:putative tape measure protein [uncultured Mediterranean phage uvMED]BAR22574.1 putative tape measure protein [uncultured Mediterranean phage uvMED]